jgi:DNA-binding YbaB/EbfC family protein
MDLRKLMKQAEQMQSQMQQQMADLEVEASVGGGMVAVKMSGSKELLAITLDKEVIDPEDPSMLQDLILAAVNEAARKVDEEMKSQLGGMGLPGMPKLF